MDKKTLRKANKVRQANLEKERRTETNIHGEKKYTWRETD